MDVDKAPASERSSKSRAILARQVNGIVADQVVEIYCSNWLLFFILLSVKMFSVMFSVLLFQ